MNRDLEEVAIQANLPILPPLSDCPPITEDNEWRSGLTYSINADGNLLSGGVFNLRPVEYFDFHPKYKFPACYVRRMPSVKPRENRVQKEKPIMSQAKAQDEMEKIADEVGFVNTGKPAFSQSYVTIISLIAWRPPLPPRVWRQCLRQ